MKVLQPTSSFKSGHNDIFKHKIKGINTIVHVLFNVHRKSNDVDRENEISLRMVEFLALASRIVI